MRLYHASQRPDLMKRGIVAGAPHVSYGQQSAVYLGTYDYVIEDYLDYAKRGTYYIYEVDVDGLHLDDNLPDGQFRIYQEIEPRRVLRVVTTIDNEPDKHSREDEYLAWYNEMQKENTMRDPFIDMISEAVGDKRALRKQVKELQADVDMLTRHRDNERRGSARRSDYASAIRRIHDKIKKLNRQIDRLDEIDGKQSLAAMLNEGGVAGHMMHLFDNWDLTFGELKEILMAAASGELEQVSEKLDGQNLFISWDMQEGKLKAARNKGNIKSGGLDAEGLASKFAGRGSVYDAFVNAFGILSKAIGSLSASERQDIFGSNADNWYSVEVMFTENPNTIVYDKNNVVFHKAGSAHFDKETGRPTNEDISSQFDKLVSRVEQMQNAIADQTWSLAAPAIMQLKKMESDEPLQHANQKISAAMGEYGIVDGDSIGLYIKTRIYIDVLDDIDVDHSTKELLARKIMGEKDVTPITKIVKGLPKEQALQLKELVKDSKGIMKKIIEPIEDAVQDFAVEVLRGLESAFIVDNSKEVERLRGEIHTAIDAIKSSGHDEAMEVLAQQMKRLKRVENIASAMEGIVFRFKGNTYKFTGAFAPANQLLGLFKYGRGKIPPLKVVQPMTAESIIRELNRRLLKRQDNEELGNALAEHFGLVTERKGKMPPVNQWHPWPAEVESIDYAGSSGVGPGEYRLAAMMGGKVQGQKTPYDIVVGNKKWEVKQPDSGRQIRPGTHGMQAIAGVMQKLATMADQLESAFSGVDPDVIAAAFDADAEDKINKIKQFIEKDLPFIRKGEISSGRVFGSKQQKGLSLVEVLGMISQLISQAQTNTGKLRKVVKYAGKDHEVDLSTYVDVGRIMNVPEEDIDVDPRDVFPTLFKSEVFRDPVGFLEEYTNSITPKEVFGHTDGVILVKPDKFMIIPRDSLDEKLKFVRISQGVARFKAEA